MFSRLNHYLRSGKKIVFGMKNVEKKWMLRYKGEPDVSAAVLLVQELKKRGLKTASSIDLPKMALIEGSSESISKLRKAIDPNWTVSEVNVIFPIPDTRKKIKGIA